jgi:uncharacterized protein YyaL (SSP411 family)
MHVRNLVFLCLAVIVLTDCTQGKRKGQGQNALNRLQFASSPYLKEHADNPVDWYEWGNDALEKAKRENKPLLISIGYSSCHWCHVMEEESFMDTAVARIMNENFVSIKIDREERPDIDQIYLNAAQLISGNSGWPLNAFALPDGKPFYAATYFPKEQWIAILKQLKDAYIKDNGNVIKQARALTEGIRAGEVIVTIADSVGRYSKTAYNDIVNKWQPHFDYTSGGLAGAPKFPMPALWEFLLQAHHLTNDKKAIEIVTITLDEMAKGGIYDQLRGGFSRYSTDANWKVPHFEKMLYDNGQLVSLYAHAYQVTKHSRYAEVVHETLEFIKNELTSPEGGFYSSVNADSEGEEGKFYVWTQDEIANTLDSGLAKLIFDYYQIADTGNWENKKNILHTKFLDKDYAAKKGVNLSQFKESLSKAKQQLLSVRNKRMRPSTDDKILVSWNALMMRGYVDAYLATRRDEYLETALKNATFLEKNLMRSGGKLWRNFKDGKGNTDAFLDDYALLSRALIQLYQATFDIHWLEVARTVTEYAVKNFRDEASGMFYYTSHDAEDLVVRKMELWDNVMPSSTSVMAEVLFLLGEYYSSPSFSQMSSIMLNHMRSKMETDSPFYAQWAALMGMVAYQPYEVAIVGDNAVERARQMMTNYNPTAIFMGGGEENLPLLKNKMVSNRTIIYVCRNRICKMPSEVVEEAMAQLR